MFNNIFRVTSPGVIEKFIDTVEDMDNKVLVKVDTMAICKADIRYFSGNRDINVLNHKYPLAPIHEAVGEIVKDPTGTYKKGDKVILVPNSFDEKYYTEKNQAKMGDTVLIAQTRPLSKTVNYELVKVLEKAVIL